MARHDQMERRMESAAHEKFTLGAAKVDASAYRALVAKHWDGKSRTNVGDERIEYLPYDIAKAIIKDPNVQPGTPTRPSKIPAQTLRNEIIDAIESDFPGLVKPGDPELRGVRFYTAAGSHLDKLHGIDAFLEVDDPQTGRTYDVTFDTTLFRPKIEGAVTKKADILIPALPDAREEKDDFYAALADIAKEARSLILAQKLDAAARG